MATRPTDNLPDWYPTNPSDLVEPSGSKKAQGYVPEEPLPAQNFNWLFYSTSTWLQYLLDVSDERGNGLAAQGDVAVSGARAVTEADDGKVLEIDSSTAGFTLTLDPVADMVNKKVTIKDIGGKLSTNPVILARGAGELFEDLDSNFTLEADYGTWHVYCDGIQYFLL